MIQDDPFIFWTNQCIDVVYERNGSKSSPRLSSSKFFLEILSPESSREGDLGAARI